MKKIETLHSRRRDSRLADRKINEIIEQVNEQKEELEKLKNKNILKI